MRTVDLAIIAAYLAGVTWFGARFKQSQTSLKDYFLGGQTAPWWAIALSIVSAETSTLTIIGTPPLAYAGSYVFLQVVFGYLLARVVISTIFLPRYFERQMFTAYELMQTALRPAREESGVRNFSGDPRSGGRGSRVCYLDRDLDHSENGRTGFDRGHHGADAFLHF